jgi:DNA-binding NarL/FixJ family response regulator
MRVLVADDSVLLREGLARILEEAGIEVVAKATTLDEILLRVRSYEPDVALLDIRMPPTQTDEGIQAAEIIFERHPDVRVLLLSQVIEAKRAVGLFADHPHGFGYLLKDRVLDIDEFLDARPRENNPLSTLTPRELDVLRLMAEGRSNQGIGHKLFLSPKTVEAHVHSIFTKLQLHQAPDDHRRVLAVLAFLSP